MRSLSSVGLAISIVFGCLFLALLAELCYLLWWKKRITNREIEDDYSSPTREFFYMFCWKRPTSLSSTALNPQELSSHAHEPNKDFWPKALGEEDELRLQNLSGPPRFLFTIKEETKEDLESEDLEKSRSRRSLSDLLLTIETPFLTPLASPQYFTPPLTPVYSYNNHKHGSNPLFESATDAEFNRMRSSPPPKFKFLKDAEEKLQRKLKEEAEKRAHKIDISVEEGNKAASPSVTLNDEEKGSSIILIVAKNKERELPHHPNSNLSQSNSSSSQVISLSSPPSTIRSPTNKKPISHQSSLF